MHSIQGHKLKLLLLCYCCLQGCPAAPQAPRFDGNGATRISYGGTFTFFGGTGVHTLDPHFAFDELSVTAVRLLFDGLIDYDYDGNFIPAMAASLPEVLNSGKLYRFILRDNLYFHNGNKLSAQDIKWSMERMLSSRTGSPGYTFYKQLVGLEAFRSGQAQSIQGIQVEDSHTIVFELEKPDQTFLNALAMTFAYPIDKQTFNKYGREISRHPVGTGPYRLHLWESGVRLVFSKYKRYWMQNKPYIDTMVFLENIGSEAGVMRFRNAELEINEGLPLADYLFFKKSESWQPYQSEKAEMSIWGLTMNCRLPPFDNVHVRRAVAFAIDRKGWSRARAGRLRPTGQVIPPGLIGYSEDLPGRQYFSIRRAKHEMKLAGYPKGYPEEVTLWMTEGNAGRFYGELTQQDLAKIGIRVRIKQVAFPVYLEETGKPKRVQMALSGWKKDFPDPSDFLDILFHSKAIHTHDSENKAFYSNPELDRILDLGRVESNLAKRKSIYESANTIVSRDAPWAFLWNDYQIAVWQPYVRNFRMHPVWDHHFRDLWLDLPKKPFLVKDGQP